MFLIKAECAQFYLVFFIGDFVVGFLICFSRTFDL